MPLAVITFAFDPYLHLGDRAVRLETIGVGAAILVGLLVAAVMLVGLRRSRAALPAAAAEAAEPLPRFDDLLIVAIAAIPGAVVGGRIGYALIHLDYYRANPSALVDASSGSLELGLAIVGATLSAAVLGRLLDRGTPLWLHVSAVPMLAALGLGKIAMALGGSGQGAAWSGSITTAYTGPGPWGSLAASVPAWPSQLLEGVAVLVASVILIGLLDTHRVGAPDGRLFLVAVWVWAVIRLVVAFTWRDASVVGPLRADQLISLGLATAAALLYVRLVDRAASRDSALRLERVGLG